MVKKLTILKVIEPFLIRPHEKLHLAFISREIKEPHPTVRQWLNTLEKKGVLKKQIKGRLSMYSLNLENVNIIDFLTIAEKNKLIEFCDKYLKLKELVHVIHSLENIEALIFGSASEDFNKAEDVDLLIIGDSDKKKIKEFINRFNKEIHIVNLSNLNKVSTSLKEEIIKKHLILRGSEEIIRWMLW